MNPQLFLFTGENTYTLKEELRRWKEGFLEKHGEANLQLMTGKDMKWNDLLDEVRVAPFLGEKRLIIVDGLPSKVSKEELQELAGGMHESSLVAFVEPTLDKRKSASKFLLKEATVKTFTPQTPKQLVGWLITLAKEKGTDLHPQVAAHLVAVVGNDQWHLKNELMKAIAYASSVEHGKHSEDSIQHSASNNELKAESRMLRASQVSINDIDKVCLPSQKHTVWVLSDLIGKGKTEEAVQFSKTLHDSGEDAFALWNILLWISKNMAAIWFHQKEKPTSAIAALAKESGVPFPSVQSLLPCVQKFSEEEMCALLDELVAADHALKTGGIKATGTEPIELMTMLERQLMCMGKA